MRTCMPACAGAGGVVAAAVTRCACKPPRLACVRACIVRSGPSAAFPFLPSASADHALPSLLCQPSLRPCLHACCLQDLKPSPNPSEHQIPAIVILSTSRAWKGARAMGRTGASPGATHRTAATSRGYYATDYPWSHPRHSSPWDAWVGAPQDELFPPPPSLHTEAVCLCATAKPCAR